MSLIWQADFYRSPLQNAQGQVLWELLVCDATRSFEFTASCPQSQANSTWVVQQLQLAGREKLPDLIQVFRPQSLSLITTAANNLGIKVEATRRTLAVKQWLVAKQYSIILDKLPPLPLPENLWGEEWRFATIPSGDIVDEFRERPIPFVQTPEFLKPINLGLASTVPIPGVVIYGGRKSMRLAQWLQESNPVSLNYIPGAPNGLILEAGLVDRWVLATFADEEVTVAGKLSRAKTAKSGTAFFIGAAR